MAEGVHALWGSAARVDRRSDLYVYFYYAGLSLLREGGVFCFINSNSWLDVGYGAKLQDFLLRRMRILQVIDNHARRSFAESEVNTIIVLLQRPGKEESCWDSVARFVAYKKPFEETVTPSNLLAIERAYEVTRSDDLRAYPITQRDILLAGAELRKEAEQAAMDFAALETLKYQGGKWGGKYLQAPDIFFTILEKGKGRLVRLGDIAEVRRGFTTGANKFFYLEPTGEPAPEGLVHVRNGAGWEGYLEAEFLKRVIKSPREIKSIFEELGLPKPNRDYSNIDPNEVSLDKVLPDRRALDEVVLEALGLMEEEQLEVYRAVVELVKTRLSKARSLRRRG